MTTDASNETGRSSVSVSQNSKGQAQISIKLYVDDPALIDPEFVAQIMSDVADSLRRQSFVVAGDA